MTPTENEHDRQPENSDPGLAFLSQARQGGAERRSLLPLVVAAVVVVLIALFLTLFGIHQKAAQRAESIASAPDPYAGRIRISNLQMSQAANFAGGKVTYIDGQVMNAGEKTVDGITVTVAFKNDIGEPPQEETMPLTLIRTREPYVDIEPVSAEPLKPGERKDFRLIFDRVTPTWNQQYPQIKVARVHTR